MKRSAALLPALALAVLPAAAQTDGASPEAAAPPSDVAEAALRDDIPSLAFDAATNALALAETDAERDRAFALAAAARERTAAPADMIAWLDETVPSSLLRDGVPPAADYFRARAFAALGRHGEAIALLRPLAGGALGDSPLAASARRDLAYSLGVSGRVSEALELAGGSEPENAPAALDLARLLLSAGEPDRALGLLEPLCADTNAPPAVAAPAALLRALALGDAGAVSNALEALEPVAGSAGTNAPPDVRALALAARAAFLADAGGVPSAEAVALAGEAAGLAVSRAARLDCDLALFSLLARIPGDADAIGVARTNLVSAAPDFPPVAAAVRDAAASRLGAGDATNALAFADLFLSSFADAPDEAAVLRVRAAALAALDRYDEASAAHLRAAEFAAAAGDEVSRLGSLRDAAAVQLEAGNARLAAATLETLLAADPPPDLRASASLLAAECLARTDPAAAPDAFEAVADEFPDAPERPVALYRAARIVAETAEDGDTNALARAEALYAAAGGMDEPAFLAISVLAAGAESATNAPPAAERPGPGGDGERPPPAPSVADPDDEAASARLRAASTLGTALVAMKAGRFAEALPLLDNVAATPGGGPASEQAAALRPSVLTALGRPAEALAAYVVFTNANPASAWLPDVRFWRAAHAFNGGNWAEAADLMSGYAADFPGTERAEHALRFAAEALLRANRFEEVGAAVRALAAANPSSALLPAARFAQGEALCRLLRFDEAADIFRDLAAPDGGDLATRALVRLGDCLFTLGGETPARYAESLEAYRAALAATNCAALGLDAECAYKTGRSLEKAGDPDAALAHWYGTVLLPYEAAPRASAAPWYSRAVFAAAAVLRARGDAPGATALLSRLAASELPGAEEARRLLSLP